MKQQSRLSIQALLLAGDRAATVGRVARRRNRDVKKSKQEKIELNTWEGEGGSNH